MTIPKTTHRQCRIKHCSHDKKKRKRKYSEKMFCLSHHLYGPQIGTLEYSEQDLCKYTNSMTEESKKDFKVIRVKVKEI